MVGVKEIPKGYKQTEVGVIPEDWEVRDLSSFCEMVSSKRIFESDYVFSGIPFYRGTEISLLMDGKNIEEPYYISKDRYEGITKQFGAPQKDEILVTAVGTLANVYLIPNDKEFYFKDGNLIWLKRIKGVDVKYFAIQIANHKNDIINNAIGSSQKALTIIVLKNQKIPIPPTKEEQTAIATVLADTDELKAKLEELIKKKRNIKQGTMQELLTGKKRLPGFNGEWEVKKLGEECELITKGTTPTSIGENFQSSGISFIKVESLEENGKIIKSKLAFISSHTNRLLSRSQLKANDILVSIAGALGRVTIIDKNILPANINQALAIARLKNTLTFDTKFVFYFLKSERIGRLIEAISVQGAQPNLSLQNIHDLPINYPRYDEQSAIAQVLSDMDTEIEELEQKLDKYKAIKQGMMQELLTGKTRLA